MAEFYGTLQGSRGETSRCGTKASGIYAQLGSWSGGVSVSLYNDPSGKACCTVFLTPWTNGAGIRRCLYQGPVDGTPYMNYQYRKRRGRVRHYSKRASIPKARKHKALKYEIPEAPEGGWSSDLFSDD